MLMKSEPLPANIAYPVKELTSGCYFNLEFRGLGVRKAGVWGSYRQILFIGSRSPCTHLARARNLDDITVPDLRKRSIDVSKTMRYDVSGDHQYTDTRFRRLNSWKTSLNYKNVY